MAVCMNACIGVWCVYLCDLGSMSIYYVMCVLYICKYMYVGQMYVIKCGGSRATVCSKASPVSFHFMYFVLV